MFKSLHQKNISIMIFGIYLFLLCWLILFKLRLNISELPDLRNINLIPFGQSAITNGRVRVSEIVYNILVFVPFGVYLEIFLSKKSFLSKLGLGLLLSLSFETIQYIFSIGASDMTDVMGNTFGCLIGLAACLLLKRVLKDRLVTIMNALGIAIEMVAISLLIILSIANM